MPRTKARGGVLAPPSAGPRGRPPRASGASGTAESIEAEEIMVGRFHTLPLFDEHPRGERAEGHPVAAVSERKQVMRIPTVGTDERQTVWRQREQSVPRAFDLNIGERRDERREKLLQDLRGSVEPRRSHAVRTNSTVAAAKQQPMVARPAIVVIRPVCIPHQIDRELQLPAAR